MILCVCCAVIAVCHQSRQSLEKAKAVLEEERGNLTAEIKTLQGGKMESERARKRAEGQLQELTARLAQAEREREEREDRLHKLQVLRRRQLKYVCCSGIGSITLFRWIDIVEHLYTCLILETWGYLDGYNVYLFVSPEQFYFSWRLTLCPALCLHLIPSPIV